MRGTHRNGLVALVVAVVTLAWLLAVPATAAEPPAPVSRVLFTFRVDDLTHVAWVNSPDTDHAVACVSDTGVVPTTPAEGRCYGPTADGEVADCCWNGDAPKPVGAVFSYDPATGLYGPGVSDTNEPPPPFAPSIDSQGATETSLELTTIDWGGDLGPGSSTEWLVTAVPGLDPPPLDAAPLTVVPISSRQTLIDGLEPNSPYTFRVRGRDADGVQSVKSSVLTATTRRPGGYLAAGDVDPYAGRIDG